ncbi:MAG: D-alanine--D-alanine ligase [Myxococcota bacterium]|nr:D-alanine--D-alanine ligase [Myxococcota bacterium]
MVRFEKAKVAVLMGGPSNERAVSLQSGQAVSAALQQLGHTVVEIDPSQDVSSQLHNQAVDVVFNALHGTFGEDGRIQGLLDWMQIPYTGEGIRSSLLAFDKVLAKQLYRAAGVPVAADLVVSQAAAQETSAQDIPFTLPVVVKPVAEGSSVGVEIIRDEKRLIGVLRAGEFDAYLIEEFIEGPEFSVVCIGTDCLGSVEIEPMREFYDYNAKYEEFGTRYHIPPRLDADALEAVERAGLDAHLALGCRAVTRSDVILGSNGPIVLETNTLPGMTGQSLVPKVAAAAGIDFPTLIQKILDLADHGKTGESNG